MNPSVIVHQREGLPRAVLTLGCTLFFDPREIDRAALDHVVAEALDGVAGWAHRFLTDDMWTSDVWSEQAHARCRALVRQSLDTGSDCFLEVESGALPDAVGEHALRYSHAVSEQGEVLGYLQLHRPIGADAMPSADAADDLLRCMLRWTDEANFLHATAGPGLNYEHVETDRDRDLAMRGYCRRHLGVDLSDMVTERWALRQHIKNARWVTFIGNRLLASHARQAALLRGLQAAMQTSQGLLIRADQWPRLGDLHRREDMDAYRTANAWLAPWLVPELFPMPGFPDEEAARDWLHMLRPEP